MSKKIASYRKKLQEQYTFDLGEVEVVIVNKMEFEVDGRKQELDLATNPPSLLARYGGGDFKLYVFEPLKKKPRANKSSNS